jgi:2-polyprenyl-3-methyl-5-hydroxy-6-metoxy-1,4-benzoquinol methylase
VSESTIHGESTLPGTVHRAPTPPSLDETLALMRHIVEHPVSARYSPWFFTYYADLTGREYLGRYIRFLDTWLAMLGRPVAGLEILDAGCGFGIMSTLIALRGGRVHGLDCHQGMIDTFNTYLDILPDELPITPQVGDVAAMPYDDASFDLVLSHEAISHYGDVDGFFREAARVLRPGGALLLSDSNNALNPQVVRDTWQIWRAFELGPAGAQVHGHTIETPFIDQRRDLLLIQAGLAKETAALLAQQTSGLWGEGLLQAARRYQETGELPGRVYRDGQCPIDPVQGYYIERLFDPRELVAALRAVGLRPSLRAYLGGARGGLLAVANTLLTSPPLTPLALRLARAFRIVAYKPSSAPSRRSSGNAFSKDDNPVGPSGGGTGK